MRRIAVACLLASSTALAGPQDLNMADRNHQLHAAVGYGLGLSGSVMLEKAHVPMPEVLSILAVTGLAVLKEKSDPIYSKGDVQAGVLGAATSALFSLTFKL